MQLNIKYLCTLPLMIQALIVCKAQYIPSDPMRFTTWNPGLNAVGGIPDRTIIFTTLSPSGGDDSDEIQAAIDNCPAGQIVQLSAGTFIVNSPFLIDKSITVRGAGPGNTTLHKTDGSIPDVEYPPGDEEPIIIIGPGTYPGPDNSTSQNLIHNGEKGDLSVTVADGSEFTHGQFVLLDELSGASWQPDRVGRGQIWASPDYRSVWNFNILPNGDTVGEPLTATTPTGGDAASWYCRQDRPTNELKEVESVNGNIITFNSPLHINYRTSHSAQLTRYTDEGNGGVHITQAGVENLTLAGGSNGNLIFTCAAYCWAKNIESTTWHGGGITLNNSFRIEIRDSYLHDASWPCPGGAGYAIVLQTGTSEALFENNISVRANKVMVARCSGTGSVFGYNYADQGFINYNSSWIECGLNASHMTGPHHVLFEGNYGFNWDSDNTHGNSIYMTVFRNHLSGIRSPFINPHNGDYIDDLHQSGNGPKRCIGAMSYSYWMSFIGNVLGTEGNMNGWLYESNGTTAMFNDGIWMLGWDAGEPYLWDTAVFNTAIRDGNWDWLQNQQNWHNSSPVTLQNSLYLTDTPAFFGSNPWPWVDPSTGTVYTLPAQQRFELISSTKRNGNPLSPCCFIMNSNYPNPFRYSTTIQYEIPETGHVRIQIIDLQGRIITTLTDEVKTTGNYTVEWNGTDAHGVKVNTGLYYCRLKSEDGYTINRLMIYLE